MPSIIVRRDGKPAREVALEKGFTLIGQKADADIKIEDPEQIEERASILQVGDDFVLSELSASAGTFVNGQAVKKRILRDRDLITVGEYRMTFQDKRAIDKPLGVEAEASAIRPQLDAAHRSGGSVDPFRRGPGGKSKPVLYIVLGAVVVAIVFASYQSYLERQAADAQAALTKKAFQGKEAEKFEQNAKVFESSIKHSDSPAEAAVAEPKH